MPKRNFKIAYILSLALLVMVLGGCSKKTVEQPTENTSPKTEETASKPAVGEMYLGQQTQGDNSKLCGWIDESDIIIKLNFADGVVKDTSYETGFYFSPIYSTMRLARSGCDYRVGFKFSELKNKGAAQVGARGYNDNNRRQLANEPIDIVFDENGKPDIGNYIEVMVLN
jgi:hypothetical protein